MTEDEKKVAFFAKPVWKRSLIVFAGPAINFIFAIILLTGLYATQGQPVTPALASAIVVDSAADLSAVAMLAPNKKLNDNKVMTVIREWNRVLVIVPVAPVFIVFVVMERSYE